MAAPSTASNNGTMLQTVASGQRSPSFSRSLYQRSPGFHQCVRASLIPWLASVRKRALAPWTRWVAYAGELAASATSAAATAANSAIFREYIRRQYLAVCIGVIRRQVDLCIEPP